MTIASNFETKFSKCETKVKHQWHFQKKTSEIKVLSCSSLVPTRVGSSRRILNNMSGPCKVEKIGCTLHSQAYALLADQVYLTLPNTNERY